MNIENISAIVFIIVFSIFLYIKRKKIDVQKIAYPVLYMALYRTKLGLKFMESFSKKFKKGLKYIGHSAVIIGFLGMLLIAFELIKNLINIFTKPAAAPGVALVLPFEVKGAFYVPFFYWIISIFLLAIVHEFSHGIFARLYGIKIKSSGIAALCVLLPVVPAAFVEPDEKQVARKKTMQQLSVFAAGPFANIVFAFVVLGIIYFLLTPVMNSMMDYNRGVEIVDIVKGKDIVYPAEKAGITKGEIISEIDSLKINNVSSFISALDKKKPSDTITLKTDKNTYEIMLDKNPANESKAYLGVSVQQKTEIKENIALRYGRFLPKAFIWLYGLFFWLYILNLGIGLFNLVPLGPVDGGRMLKTALEKYFDRKKAYKIWKWISIFFLLLILVNIVFSFIR